MKWLARFCVGLMSVIAAYLLAAVVGAFLPGKTEQVTGGDDVSVVLVAGPIHYDILLPADSETAQAFGFLSEFDMPVEVADWIVVGWGSREFYTATGTYQDLDAGVIWTAMTGDAAVMRFDLFRGDLSEFGTEITMSREQLALLRGQILQGLQRDTVGDLIVVSEAGLTATDVFLAAKGRFSILRTCNVWISDVLRGAGIKMGAWTPTPYAVTLSRWWFS